MTIQVYIFAAAFVTTKGAAVGKTEMANFKRAEKAQSVFVLQVRNARAAVSCVFQQESN